MKHRTNELNKNSPYATVQDPDLPQKSGHRSPEMTRKPKPRLSFLNRYKFTIKKIRTMEEQDYNVASRMKNFSREYLQA